ncbi:MAG: hypothetical protein N0E54_03185 [Candidatus Thiodiazotropha taylori]|nr:hypothetical protein [Candidatus Thiodiazotropha endolucinida]MCW4227731.1 hypothetical protein [Candidatus Thiodiazotropha taylori]
MKDKYPLISSVLGGIYSANVDYTNEEAKIELKNDLEHPPFKENFIVELRQAFNDSEISWVKLFDELEVMYIESEEEAKNIAKKYLWDITFDEK